MRTKTKTPDQPKACIREGARGNRQGAREYQSRRQEADREKRQELARLRHEVSLDKAGERAHRHKVADRARLKGKGLFYCESHLEREREIQLRHNEANRENR